MQVEANKKAVMMEELKHYINGKFAELEKTILAKIENSKAQPKKVEREKATRG